jgi:hypothetical protein
MSSYAPANRYTECAKYQPIILKGSTCSDTNSLHITGDARRSTKIEGSERKASNPEHGMEVLNHYIGLARPILEALYFLAAIALAAFAWKGLKQVTLTVEQLQLTREIAKTNAKREAYKLAAEQCGFFAEKVVVLWPPFVDECKTKGLSAFVNQKLTIRNGDIEEQSFAEAKVKEERDKCLGTLIPFLNALEAFAIFFASGIAEESVGYRETGHAFCGMTRQIIPFIHLSRKLKRGNYESTVKLFELWTAKLASESLTQARESAVKSLASIETTLQGIKREDIRRIGH